MEVKREEAKNNFLQKVRKLPIEIKLYLFLMNAPGFRQSFGGLTSFTK